MFATSRARVIDALKLRNWKMLGEYVWTFASLPHDNEVI